MEDWNNFKLDMEAIIAQINSLDDPIKKTNITNNLNNLLYSWKKDLLTIDGIEINDHELKVDMAIEKAITPFVIYMKMLMSNNQN